MIDFLKEFQLGTYIVAFLIGVASSYFVTIWNIRREQNSKISLDSEGIKGTADRILQIEKNTNKLLLIATQIKNQTPKNNNEYESNYNYLEENPQLHLRINLETDEKLATGIFIERHVSHDSTLAIDCGTTAAWSTSQIFKKGNRAVRIITNNIFVASLIPPETSYSENTSVWGVKEEASKCYLTDGYYYPSYGAILKKGSTGITYYAAKFAQFKPSIVILGCTSFVSENGPYARSGENRTFKKALMEYVASHSNVKLFIVLTLEKIGKTIGEPSSTESWDKLKNRDNVFVLCGIKDIDKQNSSLSDSEKAVLGEEIRVRRVKGFNHKILFVDKQAGVIDVVNSFGNQNY